MQKRTQYPIDQRRVPTALEDLAEAGESYKVEELPIEETILLMDHGQIIVKALHEPKE